jgi:hypothetical protein
MSVDRHGDPIGHATHGVNGLEQAARVIDVVMAEQDGPRLLQRQTEDTGVVQNRVTLSGIEQERPGRCF